MMFNILRRTRECFCLNTKYLIRPNQNIRFFSNQGAISSSEVRVRFAPSPTGELHLGGLRTAVYNYLFAKSQNGKFILRIEDTDENRNVPGATEGIIKYLQWAGIKYDEGPVVGGQFQPYFQSQRGKYYSDVIQQLLKDGSAYKCYCTEERLQDLRKHQILQKKVSGYDGKCRSLSETRSNELTRQGVRFCVRLKLPDLLLGYEDGILGNVSNGSTGDEGDLVLTKSNGNPTYHLANVVDDHMMNITHVMRGVEWHTATPKHLLLYQYLSWSAPQYSHIPLLLNTDGSKLSKRHSGQAVTVGHFRSLGYSSESLLNWIIGGGIKDRNFDELYSMEQLISKFSLSSMKKSGTKVDINYLSHFSRIEMEEIIKKNSTKMIENLKELAVEKYADNLDKSLLTSDFLNRMLLWSLTRPIDRFIQLVDEDYDYIWRRPGLIKDSLKPFQDLNSKEILSSLHAELTEVDEQYFNQELINKAIKNVQSENNLKKAALMKFLRTVLCDGKKGAAINSFIELLGKENVLDRISRISFQL